MSHNVDLQGVEFKDMTALRKAVEELRKEGAKIRLDETAKSFRTWAGENTRCDAAIIFEEGRHDIGLIKQPNGTYIPRFDPYGMSRDVAPQAGSATVCDISKMSHDQRHAAATIGRLTQRYAICATERAAASKGLATKRAKAKDGVIELTVG